MKLINYAFFCCFKIRKVGKGKQNNAYEISWLFVYDCVSYNITKRRLGKHALTATNSQAAAEVLLEAMFSVQSVSH
jgi:hypothetical protein